MKIQMDMSSRVKWDDILKRFLLIFLPLAILVGSITIFFYLKDTKTEQLAIQQTELINIKTQLHTVASDFDAVGRDLQVLASQNELAAYLDSGGPRQLSLLASEWLDFCTTKPAYSTIRYIRSDGQEAVKITCSGGHPEIVPDSDLKNVAATAYFKKAIALSRNTIYISPFDLNENALSRQKPFNPIIRFSIPVYDGSERSHGLLVLDYRGALLINELKKDSENSQGTTILVNADHFYLTSRNQKRISAFITTDSTGIKGKLPDDWQVLAREQSGQFHTAEGLVSFGTIYPLKNDIASSIQPALRLVWAQRPQDSWKVVSYVPAKVLSIWPAKILNRIFLLYSVCLMIIAICSFLLARTGAKRKNAEEIIREREEHLGAINKAAANAIIVIDNNKRVLHWNPAAEKLFQYTAEEVMDKPITAIIAPPKHQSALTKISKKFNIPEDSTGAKTIELFGYKKDGTEFPVEVSFSAFKSGDQWHTVGIIRDNSARKKMEKEVLRAQKFESLGVLAGGIAHDFNNLLTAIIGNINLVRRSTDPKDENYELLDNAENAARRAKSLSQQLLIFSKGGNPIRKTTAIGPLIKDSANFALHGSMITCSIHIPEDLWLVEIDAGQIGQVIQSLISNGREAITGSGSIEISCSNASGIDLPSFPAPVAGNFVRIQVRDTGCGISRQDMAKIFDPYFTTKDYGRGLGLAIVYSILQKHDAYIDVHSEPDVGTTVSVFLPAALDQHLKTDEKDDTSDADRHYQIMVVDGEEMLLKIASRMLIHLGHECICVKNSMEAIEIYKHLWKTGSPVDGVIIDLTIPGGMGGKETAGAIYDINPEAKIIVSSGYTNDPVMVDYDEYGFCAAIAKPFDMAELKDTLNAVMG